MANNHIITKIHSVGKMKIETGSVFRSGAAGEAGQMLAAGCDIVEINTVRKRCGYLHEKRKPPCQYCV